MIRTRLLFSKALVVVATGAMAAACIAQTKVVIGTAKDPNLAAQIAVANANGYFKDAGLQAEVRYFPSGGDLMTAVVGGAVGIGSSGSTPVITLRSRPYPIKIVSQIADISGAQQIIVKQDLRKPEDLYGKKIAIMRGTGSEALFNSFVKAYGFDATKVELVNMAPAEMLASFARGTVDAISVWEPNTTRARKASNGKVLVSGTKSNIPGKEGPRRIYGDHAVLFGTESFLKEQPAAVRSVLRALARADEFIASSKPEATAILAREFGLAPADMAEVMESNRYTLEMNDAMASNIDGVAAFLHGLKRIQSAPKAREWIDVAPLREVAPKLMQLK